MRGHRNKSMDKDGYWAIQLGLGVELQKISKLKVI